jgi:LAO/AO transport system kinase
VIAPHRPQPRARPTVAALAAGVLAGDRALLGQAITRVESTLQVHEAEAQALLQQLLPFTGRAVRVGITGVPGAGKSTLLEHLGRRLVAQGLRVAVLAVDPSSGRSGGSILGDKTRMQQLAADPRAFVRPSPAGGTLGGVHRRSRETLLLCEAAGYDVIFVETVGVGQSETEVARMVDTFVVLTLAGGGDELQGIKRGVLELAEVLCVNKADGDNAPRAERARREHEAALHYMRPTSPGWTTPVLTASALGDLGIDALWDAIVAHRAHLVATGELARRRQRQLRGWLWSLVEEDLLRALHHHPGVASAAPGVEAAVLSGGQTAVQGARALLAAFAQGAPT